MYLRLGQRPYAPRNFWSEESGYMVPNVSIPGDLATGHDAGPPPASGMPFDWKAGAAYQSFPPAVRQQLDGFGTVRATEILGTDDYWHELRSALERAKSSRRTLFDGMSDGAIGRCIESSILLDCHRDDHVVKRGGTARNMYVVLSGTFEAREGDRVIRPLGPGEIFGESGFLLRELRTADVYVTSDTAEVLSLSERTLRKVVDGDAADSHQLLLNLVSILAGRLATTGALTG
jgi:hypothetical protein